MTEIPCLQPLYRDGKHVATCVIPRSVEHDHETNLTSQTYRSAAARDAQASRYGGESYWRYLDKAAQDSHDHYMRKGDPERAALMFARSLSDALRGNDGL